METQVSSEPFAAMEAVLRRHPVDQVLEAIASAIEYGIDTDQVPYRRGKALMAAIEEARAHTVGIDTIDTCPKENT